MSTKSTVTRHPGGSGKQEVELSTVCVPDLWNVAMAYPKDSPTRHSILECWHLAHDLLQELRERATAARLAHLIEAAHATRLARLEAAADRLAAVVEARAQDDALDAEELAEMVVSTIKERREGGVS